MRRPHALVLPCAGQGHINPLMQLAQHLVACHGFLVTFVNTQHNHEGIIQSLKLNHNLLLQQQEDAYPTSSSASYPDIRFVGLSDGLSSDEASLASEDRKQKLARFILLPLAPLVEELICVISLSSTPLTCIIADVFLDWVPQLARRCRIPSLIGFYPSNVANLSLIYRAPFLLSSGLLNPDGSSKGSGDKLTSIPGLPDIPFKNLSWTSGNKSDNQAFFDLVLSISSRLKNFDTILLNSYHELQKEAMDALVQENLKVRPIGPLLLLDSPNKYYNVAQSAIWVEDNECLKWLEGRPKSSVLYVAFGSLVAFNVKDLHMLALGIEASRQAFIWVFGPHWIQKEKECLPEGFGERTKDRAYFIPWAPQPIILSHPSIGAFLTHCGWNSTMDAICTGVPMLTWPCFADQKVICQYILEVWKIGMSIVNCNNVVHQKQVENVVLYIMTGSEGIKLRERVAQFRERAKASLEKESGESYQNVQDIIQYVHELVKN